MEVDPKLFALLFHKRVQEDQNKQGSIIFSWNLDEDQRQERSVCDMFFATLLMCQHVYTYYTYNKKSSVGLKSL